jgi:NRAMP (natural resistance-associated macrophage protein)-like metal ion transporter
MNISKKTQQTEAQLVKDVIRSEKRAYMLGRHMLHYKGFNRFLRVLGPGVITGAADDDPSGIATYSQTGAAYGYGLLWALPLMYPLLLAVQESCARIGAVSGRGLTAIIKEHYNKKILYSLLLLIVVANTINIGADLGAMAASIGLLTSRLSYTWLTIVIAVIIVLLEVFVKYKTYTRVLKWIALVLFAYPITAFLVGQPWLHVLHETFLPHIKLDFSTSYILVGLLGTTISPYMFFWDTSETVEEEIAKRRMTAIGRTPHITKRFIRSLRLDNIAGMTLAAVTAWFIVVLCASVLFSHGIRTINTAADAARALQPLVKGFPHAGLIAKLLFSVGVVGIGFLAIPVLAGSSSYAISEALGWKEGLHRSYRRAHGFYLVIVLATAVGVVINFLGINPIKALIFTAVFNGIAAVPLLYMIARVGNSRTIMGEYVNGKLSNTFVYLACAVMSAAVLVLFYGMLTGKS